MNMENIVLDKRENYCMIFFAYNFKRKYKHRKKQKTKQCLPGFKTEEIKKYMLGDVEKQLFMVSKSKTLMYNLSMRGHKIIPNTDFTQKYLFTCSYFKKEPKM